jgi:hypothetical protein
MPYIEQGKRKDLDKWLEGLYVGILGPGELNYLITMIIRKYVEQKGLEKYQFHNDVMGVLSCVKEEWYRRKVSPYEDGKIEENGDVFEDAEISIKSVVDYGGEMLCLHEKKYHTRCPECGVMMEMYYDEKACESEFYCFGCKEHFREEDL